MITVLSKILTVNATIGFLDLFLITLPDEGPQQKTEAPLVQTVFPGPSSEVKCYNTPVQVSVAKNTRLSNGGGLL